MAQDSREERRAAQHGGLQQARGGPQVHLHIMRPRKLWDAGVKLGGHHYCAGEGRVHLGQERIEGKVKQGEARQGNSV